MPDLSPQQFSPEIQRSLEQPAHPGLGPEPGTTEVAPGRVRLYHYTKDEESLESIKLEGISQERAVGESYGEPNAVWASARQPLWSKPFVEFHASPEEMNIGSESTPENLEARQADVTMRGSVGPEKIVAHNQPWHHTTRSILTREDMRADLDAGEYDDMADAPGDLGRSIREAKAASRAGPTYF